MATGQGERIELPMKWISDSEKTYDLEGWMKCENCDSYVGPDGNMLGRLGRLSVYYIEPENRVWISMVMACPLCAYGAIAHQEFRDEHFYKPSIPFDGQHWKHVPPGLNWKQWRVLGIWSETGDTYLDAARKITGDPAWEKAKAGLVEKLEKWEEERNA